MMPKLAQPLHLQPVRHIGLLAAIVAGALTVAACYPRSHADHVSIMRDGKPEAVSATGARPAR